MPEFEYVALISYVKRRNTPNLFILNFSQMENWNTANIFVFF